MDQERFEQDNESTSMPPLGEVVPPSGLLTQESSAMDQSLRLYQPATPIEIGGHGTGGASSSTLYRDTDAKTTDVSTRNTNVLGVRCRHYTQPVSRLKD